MVAINRTSASKPAALVLLRGHVFRTGSKLQYGVDCRNATILREQREAFASHHHLVTQLSRSYHVTTVLHTYRAGEECHDVLQRMLADVARSIQIVEHDSNIVQGQGRLWRAAFSNVLFVDNVRSFGFAIVVRADLLLRDGAALARSLLRGWDGADRAVFIAPSIHSLHGLPPILHTQADDIGTAFLRNIVCTEYARLFSPTPWIADQVHLVPRALFPLARRYFFGHEATECLQEVGGRWFFLSPEPIATDTSTCANRVYTIIGRPAATQRCVFNSSGAEFSTKCGARMLDPACAGHDPPEPRTFHGAKRRCEIVTPLVTGGPGSRAHREMYASMIHSRGCRGMTLDASVGWGRL